MDEVGSASGVLEAVQQLSTSLGGAVLGTIFFSAFAGHVPAYALAVTAWACLVPLAGPFARGHTAAGLSGPARLAPRAKPRNGRPAHFNI
jgi:hypothetical protein